MYGLSFLAYSNKVFADSSLAKLHKLSFIEKAKRVYRLKKIGKETTLMAPQLNLAE